MRFEEYKLGDLIESISVTHKFPEEKIIFLNTSDILEGSILTDEFKDVDSLPGQAKKSITKGDILYSEIRPKNKRYAFIDFDSENYVVSTKLMVLRVKDSRLLNNKYLYYYLTSSKIVNHLQNLAESRSGTFPQITFSEIASLEITLPTLQIQKRVVDFMDNLNDKLEINNTIISNLEELAQTLFKRWFVDFEFPNEEGKPYKSSGGKMVESELGMIPEGWEVKQLNEVVRHSKKSFNPNKESQIAVAHFSLPAYDSQQYPAFEDSKTIKSNKYYINENSVMFSRMNPKTPRTWLPNIQSKYINVCSSEYVVLDTSLYANKGYIFSLISSNDFNNYLLNNATGSTNSRQRVRPEVALQYAFVFDENVAKEFEQKIGSFYKEIISLREEIFTLSNLRDTLLPKLLSGEIELPDDMEVTDDVPIS